MAVPKRKSSKRKVRARRGARVSVPTATKTCPQCGAPHRPHRVCPACGYYRGRQVITISGE